MTDFHSYVGRGVQHACEAVKRLSQGKLQGRKVKVRQLADLADEVNSQSRPAFTATMRHANHLALVPGCCCPRPPSPNPLAMSPLKFGALRFGMSPRRGGPRPASNGSDASPVRQTRHRLAPMIKRLATF